MPKEKLSGVPRSNGRRTMKAGCPFWARVRARMEYANGDTNAPGMMITWRRPRTDQFEVQGSTLEGGIEPIKRKIVTGKKTKGYPLSKFQPWEIYCFTP